MHVSYKEYVVIFINIVLNVVVPTLSLLKLSIACLKKGGFLTLTCYLLWTQNIGIWIALKDVYQV